AAAHRIGQLPRRRQHFVRDLPELSLSLLEYCKDVGHHSTLASLRSAAISAGTASGPSPRMRPSLRAGGSARSSRSTPPAPAVAALTSSGYFFAAMMPLSAG